MVAETMRFEHRVALAADEPARHRVVGELTLPDGDQPDTVQLLIHGATYGRAFWDFPLAPERHSYVRALSRRGHALCGFDRLGNGDSDQPAPELLTTEAHAHVAVQLVDALRDGSLGPAFARVIVVGHSYGSVVATVAAARRPDIDGLVVSSLLHRLDSGLAALTDCLRPACDDTPERFGALAPGYLTTAAGSRSVFYVGSDPEPAIVARDEELKQVHTETEAATYLDGLALSAEVTVPTLVVVGDHDSFFCTAEPCSTPGTGGLALEPPSWPRTSPTFATIPGAPHALTTDRAAPRFFAAVADWCDALSRTG